jgi:hypothetical protein
VKFHGFGNKISDFIALADPLTAADLYFRLTQHHHLYSRRPATRFLQQSP